MQNSKWQNLQTIRVTSLYKSTGGRSTWAATCAVNRRRRACWGNVDSWSSDVARSHFRMPPRSVNTALSKQPLNVFQLFPAKISESTVSAVAHSSCPRADRIRTHRLRDDDITVGNWVTVFSKHGVGISENPWGLRKGTEPRARIADNFKQNPRLKTELILVGPNILFWGARGAFVTREPTQQTHPTPFFQTMRVKTAAADTRKVAGGGGCGSTKAQSPVGLCVFFLFPSVYLSRATLCWVSPRIIRQNVYTLRTQRRRRI